MSLVFIFKSLGSEKKLGFSAYSEKRVDHFKAFILEKCTLGAKYIAGSCVRLHVVYTMPDAN